MQSVFQGFRSAVALLVLCRISLGVPGDVSAADRVLILVQGAAGQPEYEPPFAQATAEWIAASAEGRFRLVTIGQEAAGEESHRDQLRRAIANAMTAEPAELWIVLNGHGTDDGRSARFNLEGPDFSAKELRDWLDGRAANTVVIHTGSASGGFIGVLSARQRVVITATRSSQEQNVTRFGRFLSRAITDPQADIERDGTVSLLEAFLSASRRTAESYETENRLATEHALLDDNGDGQGVGMDAFRGVHPLAGSNGETLADGVFAHQLSVVPREDELDWPQELLDRRQKLERELAQLRARRDTFADEQAYYAAVEPVLIELARLYASAERRAAADP